MAPILNALINISQGFAFEGENITIVGIDVTAASTVEIGALGFEMSQHAATWYYFPAICGLLSTLSVVGLFAFLAWRSITDAKGAKAANAFFFGNPLGIVMLSMFATELLQALGWTMSFHYGVTASQFVSVPCTFQAVAECIGLLAGGVWSMYLSLLTFSVLVLSTRVNLRVLSGMLGVGWAFVIAITVAGPVNFAAANKPMSRFFGPQAFSCWISGSGIESKIFVLLVEIISMVSIGVSGLLYIFIFLRVSGRLRLDGFKLSLHWQATSSHGVGSHSASGGNIHGGKIKTGISEAESINAQVVRICRRLILYPVIFCVTAVPLGICRLWPITHQFGNARLPWVLLQVCCGIEALSGFANVLLFVYTRHSLVIQTSQTGLTTMGVQVHTQTRTFSAGPADSYAMDDIAARKRTTNVSQGSDEDITEEFNSTNKRYASSVASQVDTLAEGPAVSEIELLRGKERAAMVALSSSR